MNDTWKDSVPFLGRLYTDPKSPIVKRIQELERRLVSDAGEVDPYRLGLARGELVALRSLAPERLERYLEAESPPPQTRAAAVSRLPLPRNR